ncbi:MAG: thioredoxin domain-containing protein [Pseudomonadota bacterium]|nr:thioredoxin domain-containing protein [Pseudomonadota bacterium]
MERLAQRHTCPASLETFQRDVIERSAELPVLVDFWAKWCSPCLVIAPVLEKVARRYAGRVVIAKLEVDAGRNMKLAGQYQVRGFPTVILFRDGVEQDRFGGARTERHIDLFIEAHL